MKKCCPRCKLIKPLTEFPKHRTCTNGRAGRCKKCCEDVKLLRVKKRRSEGVCINCEDVLSGHFYRCEKCRTYARERRKKYYQTKHGNRCIQRCNRKYQRKPSVLAKRREESKTPAKRAQVNEYIRRRHQNNIQYRIAHNLRSRFSHAFRTNAKQGSAIRDLGCSISALKQHLESLFLPNMSWDNYGCGREKWNIDHIIPLWSINVANNEDISRVSHYTNLRPLWQVTNTHRNINIKLSIRSERNGNRHIRHGDKRRKEQICSRPMPTNT